MDTTSLWQAVLGEIELGVTRGNYVTWFKSTRLLKIKDGCVQIGTPNVFGKQQLEKRFDPLIKETLQKHKVAFEKVEYKIIPSSGLHKRIEDESVVLQNQSPVPVKKINQSSQPSQKTHPSPPSPSSLTHTYRQGLSEKYTFDNFIVGDGNELAYAACQGIAQNPGTKYNPLFLYGGVGIGKTHLIQAVGNGVISNNPGARIVYVSSEQFIQEFLDAIRYKKNTDFAATYRSADVLIIDDIQFIAGKEKTQDEFFHTFNALHQANKQIIITSDRRPKDIPTLTDRLRSRFEWGMAIDMQAPDFETRCAIIQAKAVAQGTELPPETVEHLANHVQNNIRELEGALNQLLATCEIRNIEPTAEVAATILGGSKSRPKHINAKQIIERTAKHFQLSVDELLGPKRDKEIVVPRQIAMYMLRSELHLSFPKIARELGRKDHTTAIHSVDKINKEQVFDEDLRSAIADIKERLYV